MEGKNRVEKRKRKQLLDGISVCIIALNEEHRIASCMSALSFAGEIILIDGGSVDSTAEIAKRQGAKVFRREFDGFVNQRNFSLSKARFSWILVVDADEIVSEKLQKEILQVTAAKGSITAFRIPRKSFYLGQWIHHGGWYPDYNIRLFRNGSGRYAGGLVHETVQVRGSAGTLRNHLEHYSYNTVSDHLIRIDQYSTLIAQDRFLKGKKSSIPWAILKGAMKFFLMYFYRLGFLDGRSGLVIAIMGSIYNFLKYVKLWELNAGLRVLRDVKFRKG